MITTPGKILINSVLPEKYRGSFEQLDEDSLQALTTRIAREDPEKYIDIIHGLQTIAKESTTTYGHGTSVKLEDLRTPPELREHKARIQHKVRQIINDPRYSATQKKKQITDYMFKELKRTPGMVKDVMSKKETGFGLQLRSGARGNPSALTQTMIGDLMLADADNKPVPIPSVHGYGYGLTPLEYWAAANGARKGTSDVQFATADSGYLCLDGDTKVRMADFTEKAIRDIAAGDLVMGADTKGSRFPVKVTAVFDNGTQEIFTFKFRRGRCRSDFVYLSATPNHEVFGEVKLGSSACSASLGKHPLALGMKRKLYSAMPAGALAAKKGIAVKSAFSIGCLVGDGCLRSCTPTLSCADDVLIKEVEKDLHTIGFIAKLIERDNEFPDIEYLIRPNKRIDPQRNRKGHAVTTNNPLLKTLDKLGVYNKLSYDKKLTDFIYTWDKQSLSEFLGGLFDADGSVTLSRDAYIPYIRLDMTSESVVRETKRILELVFGIYTSPVEVTEADGITRDMVKYNLSVTGRHTLYTLSITTRTNIERFVNQIHMKGRKGLLLRQLWEDRPASKRNDDYSFSLVDWCSEGERSVYDIEVDHKDHMFVLANGLIVGNSKQLNNMGHRTVVTEEDCGTVNGLEVEGGDSDNIGSVLAAPAGGLEAGEVITKNNIGNLEGKDVMVRSTISCQAKDGICARCSGKREDNEFPIIGEQVGAVAARAMAEPITQAALSIKHSGGVAGQDTDKISGFEALNQFLQVPKTFRGGSVLAQKDGMVTSIKENPARTGKLVTIDNEEHYVPNENKLLIKKGQRLDAGDMLSDGIPNPAELTYFKGVGEGRKYFVEQYRKMLDENRGSVHRRNIEALARSFINRVEIDSPDGYEGHIIGDVVPYDDFVRDYKPRKNSEQVSANKALKGYLEKPVLHYSIGTKITSKVLKDLSKHKINSILINREPPPFKPKVVRSVDFLKTDPDWMTRLGGEGLQKSTLKAVHQGGTSIAGGTSYFPTVADATKLERYDKEKI